MKKRDVVERAWNRLRLVLLWARERGVLRCKLVMELRVVPKCLNCLGHATTPKQAHYDYERQLSFDNTPIFNANNMYRSSSTRFHIPCFNPPLHFDDDRRNSSLIGAGYHQEEEIDVRAEEFIAKFHQQLKLQRQISYLHYINDTPNVTEAPDDYASSLSFSCKL